MRAVKSRNTKPEMVLRRLLHRAGYRYRLHPSNLPGKPDMVFPSRRKAIFVHGCLWHQHPGCRYADRPAANREYWDKKLSRNMARDASNQEELQQAGWGVHIVWECELRREQQATLTATVHFLDSPSANG